MEVGVGGGQELKPHDHQAMLPTPEKPKQKIDGCSGTRAGEVRFSRVLLFLFFGKQSTKRTPCSHGESFKAELVHVCMSMWDRDARPGIQRSSVRAQEGRTNGQPRVAGRRGTEASGFVDIKDVLYTTEQQYVHHA